MPATWVTTRNYDPETVRHTLSLVAADGAAVRVRVGGGGEIVISWDEPITDRNGGPTRRQGSFPLAAGSSDVAAALVAGVPAGVLCDLIQDQQSHHPTVPWYFWGVLGRLGQELAGDPVPPAPGSN